MVQQKFLIATVVFMDAGEIDRCLKKVQEGVDIFEDLWQKVGVVSVVGIHDRLFSCQMRCRFIVTFS